MDRGAEASPHSKSKLLFFLVENVCNLLCINLINFVFLYIITLQRFLHLLNPLSCVICYFVI